MHIWILLRHKYLRTSSVNIDDRRFLFQDLGTEVTLSSGRGENEDLEAKKFPVCFSNKESEPINQMTDEINKKLEFLFRGTTDVPAVGSLASNISLPDAKDHPQIE